MEHILLKYYQMNLQVLLERDLVNVRYDITGNFILHFPIYKYGTRVFRI